jgi:tetratricopeptide (TPR) repeat protein
VGHGYLQWIDGQLGNFEIARREAVAFDKAYVPERHRQVPVLNDMKAWVDGWSAHHLWIMGWPDQAKQTLYDGIEHARAIGNPLNLIFCLAHGGALFFYRREPERLFGHLDEASRLAKDHALHFMDGMLIAIWRGSALMLSERYAQALETMQSATALSLAANMPIMIPCHWLMTAEALAGLGRFDEAMAMLDGELATIAKTGERIHEAEILRLRADAAQRSVAIRPGRGLPAARARPEPSAEGEGLGTAQLDQSSAPLAEPGKARGSPRAPRPGLQLVHRRP